MVSRLRRIDYREWVISCSNIKAVTVHIRRAVVKQMCKRHLFCYLENPNTSPEPLLLPKIVTLNQVVALSESWLNG